MTRILVLSSFLFFANTVYADIDLVSQSGIWAAACPPVFCSAPGDSWYYSFESDSNLDTTLGEIRSTITDFEFLLNGSPVASLDGAYDYAYWYPQDNDGGFAMGGTQFGFWTQLFSAVYSYSETGSILTATLVPGVYPISSNGSAVEVLFDQPGAVFGGYAGADGFIPGPVVITDLSTPEPASIIFLGTVLIGVGFRIKRKFS